MEYFIGVMPIDKNLEKLDNFIEKTLKEDYEQDDYIFDEDWEIFDMNASIADAGKMLLNTDEEYQPSLDSCGQIDSTDPDFELYFKCAIEGKLWRLDSRYFYDENFQQISRADFYEKVKSMSKCKIVFNEIDRE